MAHPLGGALWQVTSHQGRAGKPFSRPKYQSPYPPRAVSPASSSSVSSSFVWTVHPPVQALTHTCYPRLQQGLLVPGTQPRPQSSPHLLHEATRLAKEPGHISVHGRGWNPDLTPARSLHPGRPFPSYETQSKSHFLCEALPDFLRYIVFSALPGGCVSHLSLGFNPGSQCSQRNRRGSLARLLFLHSQG